MRVAGPEVEIDDKAPVVIVPLYAAFFQRVIHVHEHLTRFPFFVCEEIRVAVRAVILVVHIVAVDGVHVFRGQIHVFRSGVAKAP